ncbi:TPA: hypothetical protein ACQQX6_000661 [Yersinia enterocolitica]|uniref:Uncharacterized protein n=2 Tax=Yersinia TaxID=629 RepID=A0AA36PGJ8_YERMO|nr:MULTISPECIES: hypothetical protein [Yersiniaceae]MDW5507482.1 hypothetical protein [Pseudomonas lundensis]EKN3530772.1 hypothetical protein [Yersinia enterocolitica]EKN4744985.1 hypothetical protein [Yersinia enterocolitica]EKN4840704.1 hypothetical protein [Yersinia enterocolitica]ELI7994104.1 hypothetical protein [Yersinia enterocolitica]
MAHEITLEKAAEMARQAELVCLLLESHPHELQDSDVVDIASLVAKLAGRVAGWLIEEQAQRVANHD